MDPYPAVFRNLKSVELQRHSAIKFPLPQIMNYHKKINLFVSNLVKYLVT